MKKTIFFISLCLATLTANAQFKVHSTGQVSITTTALPSNNAKLTLDYEADQYYKFFIK